MHRILYIVFVLQVGSKYGLAYDAVHLYALAFRKIIDLNKTITGPDLASAIRLVKF